MSEEYSTNWELHKFQFTQKPIIGLSKELMEADHLTSMSQNLFSLETKIKIFSSNFTINFGCQVYYFFVCIFHVKIFFFFK